MEPARAASGEHPKAFLMEPLGSGAAEPEQPPVPAEERPPEKPESSPLLAPAATEAGAASPEPAGGEKAPPPRPALLRVPPPSLGYGAFRRQVSAGPEPPSPAPLAAQPPRDADASGTELAPGAAPGEAAPGEAAPGPWAPVELQVDVRVTPVGAAGGSRAPSPAPSTRFLTVPVPESPAFARHAAPAHPLLPRTPSPGGTWGRGAPAPLAARPERGRDADAWAGAAGPGAPARRCRCRELGLDQGDPALLRRAEVGAAAAKLSRAVKLVGLPAYLRSLQWALAILAVLLAVSAVAIVALASRAGVSCQACAKGWILAEEHCYYLSTDVQAWEASQAFCAAHQATLPLLSHTQDFLGRYPVTQYTWVGARRGSQGWHWMDGAPLPPELSPEDDDNQPDGHCAGLQGGKLVAFDCAAPRPWVCVTRTQ